MAEPILRPTKKFTKALRKKAVVDQRRIARALDQLLLEEPPAGLGVKKMTTGEDPAIWEARASDSLRITFSRLPGNVLLLVNNCHHELVE